MTVVAGPFTIAALLLIVGGVLKAWQPDDTARAMRGLGLPSSSAFVRVVSATEVLVGAAAVGFGDPISAVLVAVSYVGFAGFVGLALVRRAPIATCGCFGRSDTAPNPVHVGLDAAAATVAVIAATASGGVGLPTVLRSQPLAGVPYLGLVLLGTYAAFMAYTLVVRPLPDRAHRET